MPILVVGSIALVIAAGAQRVVNVSGLLKGSDITEYARAAKRLLASSFVIRLPRRSPAKAGHSSF
jgi:hypothetical protein